LEKSQNKKPTPIIALTAYATEGFRERCLKNGMNDYLTKPLRRKLLLGLLEKYLMPETQEVRRVILENENEENDA
jgi:CheY-like chemotaxis protein